MIVDSSAIIAILLDEPERASMIEALVKAPSRSIAVPNWLETCMVFDGRGRASPEGSLENIRLRFGIGVVAFDHILAQKAHAAFRRYGRGTQHPARLNFGDCMAYALAKHSGEPLLFKGEDFVHTDVTPALN